MRLLPAVVILSLTVGCADPAGPVREELLVFAAASLTDAFAAAEAAFEAEHQDVDVVVHTAGSQRLAAQILEGAPADVFASADTTQMDRVVAAGETAGQPTIFARNRLTVAVAPGNPRGITGPAQLARGDLTVVLAEENVPLGAYTRRLLDRLGIRVTPASLELDARAVLGRVALGEADAGIVYTSDVVGREDVEEVVVPEAVNVSAEYPVVVLRGAPPVARVFADFLRTPTGEAILRDAGLGIP